MYSQHMTRCHSHETDQLLLLQHSGKKRAKPLHYINCAQCIFLAHSVGVESVKEVTVNIGVNKKTSTHKIYSRGGNILQNNTLQKTILKRTNTNRSHWEVQYTQEP